MRLSFFAVLSGLAAPAIVNAYPVQNWMHKRDDATPSVYPTEPTHHRHNDTSSGYPPMPTPHHHYNGTTSADSPKPTSTPPEICCVTPGVPPLCTECRPQYNGTSSGYPSMPTHHHQNGTSSAEPNHWRHHHHHHNGTSSADPSEPTHHPSNDTRSTYPLEPLPHSDSTFASSFPPRASMPDKSASELAQKQPAQFLSDLVFQGLLVDEFKFGRGSSGNVGSNMISQYVVAPSHTQPGGLKSTPGHDELAIHLNCVVTASALRGNSLPIRVELFHITARSLTSQKLIDAHGPSAITADKSIHMNVNTGWGRENNLKALASEVRVDKDETLHFEVSTKQGYNGAYMRGLVKGFRTKVEQRIHQLLGGNVVIQWKGDKTFPTQ